MLSSTLLLLGITLVGLISPGPDMVLVIKNSSSYDRKAALYTAMGITIGCLVHVVYCLLGIGLIISESILMYSTIKYAGAAYLIYLGIKGLRSKKTVGDIVGESEKVGLYSRKKAFIEGFLCNLLNPKATVFFLSLFTQFITPETTALHKLVYASSITVLNITAWGSIVLVIQRPKVQKWLSNAGHIIDRVFGGLLIAIGTKVAVSD